MRRYKRRLKNHHHTPQREVAMELARDTIIAPEEEDDDGNEQAVNGHDDQPIIIAESKKEIPRVSVGDAVMLMDLADANAFVFRNRKSETLEVVYRRQDGNIGWISPVPAVSAFRN